MMANMRQTTRGVILALLVIVALVVVAVFDVPPLALLRDWADSLGVWFPVAYWGAYVGITQFPVPRTILTLTAGVLFGPWIGILIALTATAVAAAISLTVVRYLLADWVRPRLTHPLVGKIDDRLRARGWAAVVSLRLIAGVPFSIMNYASALTSIRLTTFTTATFLGSAPGSIVTVFFGDTLTGQANPAIIMTTILLAVIGVIGLAVDARLPVKSRE